MNAFFVRTDLCDDHFGPPRQLTELERAPAFTAHPFGHPRSLAGLGTMPAMDVEQLRGVTVHDLAVRRGPATTPGFLPVDVTIRNDSDRTLRSGDPNPVNLSIRWVEGPTVPVDAERTSLPVPVPARTSRTVVMWTRPPDEPGEHRLRVTLVQEGVFWRRRSEDLVRSPTCWSRSQRPAGPGTAARPIHRRIGRKPARRTSVANRHDGPPEGTRTAGTRPRRPPLHR